MDFEALKWRGLRRGVDKYLPALLQRESDRRQATGEAPVTDSAMLPRTELLERAKETPRRTDRPTAQELAPVLYEQLDEMCAATEAEYRTTRRLHQVMFWVFVALALVGAAVAAGALFLLLNGKHDDLLTKVFGSGGVVSALAGAVGLMFDKPLQTVRDADSLTAGIRGVHFWLKAAIAECRQLPPLKVAGCVTARADEYIGRVEAIQPAGKRQPGVP